MFILGQFGNLGVELFGQLALVDGDLEDAAKAFIHFFNDLHRIVILGCQVSRHHARPWQAAKTVCGAATNGRCAKEGLLMARLRGRSTVRLGKNWQLM
jgi:hypothetical protein